jgi:Flp pilus assembly protein TadG
MNARMTRNASNCRGVATIEFAICAPLLLLLLFATAEVGRLMYQYNTLTKAVRDGVRFAVNEAAVGSTRVVNITPLVRTQTRNLVVSGNVNGAGAPLLPGLSAANVTISNDANGFVTVSAVYTFIPAIGASLPTFGLGAPISLAAPLTATVVMRAL